MKIYKVSCEFFIEAKNKEEAEEIVVDDFAGGDFYEEHIIIEESDCKEEDIFNRN